MSRTEDERLGLGWEVWFLLALLAAGALAALQILGLIGGGFDSVTQPRGHRGSVEIDPRRLVLGGSVAIALGTAAIRLILSTTWHLDPSGDMRDDGSPQR